jgi:hypothetical protein
MEALGVYTVFPNTSGKYYYFKKRCCYLTFSDLQARNETPHQPVQKKKRARGQVIGLNNDMTNMFMARVKPWTRIMHTASDECHHWLPASYSSTHGDFASHRSYVGEHHTNN